MFALSKKLMLGLVMTMLLTATAHAVDCIVNPNASALLGASERGIIAEILVERGDKVRKGDVLLKLESQRETMQLEQAEIAAANKLNVEIAQKQADLAKARVDRISILADKQIVSQAELLEAVLDMEVRQLQKEQAELDIKLAEINVKELKAAKERKTIRSPFDGVIVERLASVGEIYTEERPPLRVVGINPLYVETYLPLSDRPKVETGNSLPITLEDGSQATAKVTVIDPVLDPATGTFGVRLELPNPDFEILSGQHCTVDFSQARSG